MIYVDLKGRIGNQLFIYAFAENLRQKRKRNETIIFNDYHILQLHWKNSLEDYKIVNVLFDHSKYLPFGMMVRSIMMKLTYHIACRSDYRGKYLVENRFKKLWSLIGIVACQNGFVNIPISTRKNIYVSGYFQSPSYFSNYNQSICDTLRLTNEIEGLKNPDIEKIKIRNTVCVSIKVEHNVDNPIYDVCGGDYWERAINYITERVEKPLFFICSDNVEYVKSHLIDTQKYDIICQDKSLPVHLSLAIMGLCKHFIIGNTSFGWWAQHMSKYSNKIVIVPKPWTRVDIPVDIYEDNMIIMDVSNFIKNERK